MLLKSLLIVFFMVASLYGFSQSTDSSGYVTFIAIFDKNKATKDGYYVNEYIVDISYKKAHKLDRKQVKISGKVSILKGFDQQPKEFDAKGYEVASQGRATDTKYILSPKIEVIK